MGRIKRETIRNRLKVRNVLQKNLGARDEMVQTCDENGRREKRLKLYGNGNENKRRQARKLAI